MATATQAKLPPGPRGTWRPTLQLIKNPRQAMERWVSEYGDPFFLNALNGPVVVTGREDLIRVIYGQDPSLYTTFATQTIGALMGDESIFVMDGDQHRQERKLLMPLFHGDRMKAYGPLMQETAQRQLESRDASKPISALQLMTDISLEVIVRAIFGGDRPEIVQRMMAASRNVVAKSNPLLFFSKKTHVSFLGLSPLDRWRAAQQGLTQLFDEVIDDAAQHPERQDILSMLYRADESAKTDRKRIHSELTTLLFAGHETTALTLTWAIYHLHRHPEILSRLREELDHCDLEDPEALARAPYLKAVIQETLRVHPIVTETLRKLNRPLQLDGYLLPEGMGLAIATVLAHYQTQTWEDPEAFRPERFLERDYSPFVYMPYGGGHRRCLGAAFANYEMAMVLGVLLKRYEFELIDQQEVVPKRRSVTMGPATEIPIRLKSERTR